jgi:hypothetical protein
MTSEEREQEQVSIAARCVGAHRLEILGHVSCHLFARAKWDAQVLRCTTAAIVVSQFGPSRITRRLLVYFSVFVWLAQR